MTNLANSRRESGAGVKRKCSTDDGMLESFQEAMRHYKSSVKLNIHEQTQKFLKEIKDYDPIGKIIKGNMHNEVFRDAFKGLLKSDNPDDLLGLIDQ